MQKLVFENKGWLDVVATWVPLNLHRTVDGGFYYAPNEPLTDPTVCDSLPEPHKTDALAFIADQKKKAGHAKVEAAHDKVESVHDKAESAKEKVEDAKDKPKRVY